MSKFALFASALAIAAPAVAADPAPTAKVVVGDLDLASAGGQRLLARRIGAAVEQVCGSYANAPDPADQMRIGECRDAAFVDARQQIAMRQTNIRLAARN